MYRNILMRSDLLSVNTRQHDRLKNLGIFVYNQITNIHTMLKINQYIFFRYVRLQHLSVYCGCYHSNLFDVQGNPLNSHITVLQIPIRAKVLSEKFYPIRLKAPQTTPHVWVQSWLRVCGMGPSNLANGVIICLAMAHSWPHIWVQVETRGFAFGGQWQGQ